MTSKKDEIIINGVKVRAADLMSLFMIVFDPEPEKWYRFEKGEDELMIEVTKEIIKERPISKEKSILQ